MGVVYYAQYFVYCERGRAEFLRAYGVPYRELEARGVLLPMIEAVCRYLEPARFVDELTIVMRVPERTGARLMMECEVWRDDEKLVEGHTWHAAVTPDGRPCRLPKELVALCALAQW